MAGDRRLTRTALRGFALAIRAARALGLQARWTFPSRANRRVAASGLFDPQGYLQAYPHAGLGPLSPLDHFRLHGARAGYDPNPYFATAWYLANNPDVRTQGSTHCSTISTAANAKVARLRVSSTPPTTSPDTRMQRNRARACLHIS